MEIDKIIDVIVLGVFVIGLLALLFLMVFLDYKDEKKWRELRNEELEARIKFYKDFLDHKW